MKMMGALRSTRRMSITPHTRSSGMEAAKTVRNQGAAYITGDTPWVCTPQFRVQGLGFRVVGFRV